MLGIFVKTRTDKRLSSHLLVILQVVFLVLSCYPVGLTNTGSVYFLLLCAAGAGLGLFVLYYNRPSNFAVYPEVRVEARLVTQGPYKYVRHPMYVALVLMMVGIAGYNGHWINFAGAAGIATVVYLKSLREEDLLQQAFAEYAEYRARTARFLPRLW